VIAVEHAVSEQGCAGGSSWNGRDGLSQVINVLVGGLALGLIYALFALGFGLVFSTLGEMNFAYGDGLMISAFVAYRVHLAGVPIGFCIVIAMVTGTFVGLCVNFIAMAPLRGKGGTLPLIVSGLGLALVVRNIAVLLFGAGSVGFPDIFGSGQLTINGQRYSFTVVAALGIAICAVPVLNLFLARTAQGRYIRAVAQDKLASRLTGVPVLRTNAVVYGISGAVGALAGVMFVSNYGVLNTSIGFQATIVAFVAAVLGGVGSLWGAVLGGILLGLAQTAVGTYLSALYETTFTYALMIAVLCVLPRGLFGQRSAVRV
jgi:branched-chain amino acid transport system permease protein